MIALFFVLLLGILPTTWIDIRESSMERTVSLIEATKGAVKVRIGETLYRLHSYVDENGLMYVSWKNWPDVLKQALNDSCRNETSFVCNVPTSVSLRFLNINRVEFIDYAGKSFDLAKRLMTLDGFFHSLLFNIVFNLLFRCCTRPRTFSYAKIVEDVVTGTVACVAVFALKTALFWSMVRLSASLSWTLGTFVGSASARLAKLFLKKMNK